MNIWFSIESSYGAFFYSLILFIYSAYVLYWSVLFKLVLCGLFRKWSIGLVGTRIICPPRSASNFYVVWPMGRILTWAAPPRLTHKKLKLGVDVDSTYKA